MYCRLKRRKTNTEKIKIDIISKSQLIHEIKRQNIINAINYIPEGLIQEFKDEWFEFLIEYPQQELTSSLIQRLINCYKYPNEYESSIFKIKQILNLIPIYILEKELYDKLLSDNNEVIEIIKDLDLFSPKYALDMCNKGKLSYALDILNTNSRQYSKDDVILMKQIYDRFNNLPDIGKIEIVKGGLLGKDMEKYICPNGHKNNVDSEFCCQCELNIKGLSKTGVNKIKNFASKIQILEQMFN